MLYLASKSPRRRKLIKLLNFPYKSFSVDVDENFLDGEHPVKTVKRLSELKMNAAKRKVNKGIIITADTIVVLNHKILGKPNNKADAVKMLQLLSGKSHFVYTGFTVYNSVNNKQFSDYEKTKVTFRKLELSEIEKYVNSGSPLDKAGSYGIQDDYGALFVKKIEGCYYNVVGLPISKLNSKLKLVL
ncbi:MAG: septum formation protein Maf [Ignavibacteriae bacterium]|nr:septum formation protein Maf [Ignavibacteriota bacterium]